MASKAIGMVEHNTKYQNKNVKRYEKIYFYRSIFFFTDFRRIFVCAEYSEMDSLMTDDSLMTL